MSCYLQNFKEIIPYEYVLYIFQLICNNEQHYVVFNEILFKKHMYHNNIISILDELSKYYLPSKQNYIQKGNKYKGFITILRHLCKLWNIEYKSKIKYDKNNYIIEYYFYI